MQVSATGRRIIEAFEGCEKAMSNGMYAPYYDFRMVLKQGYGHTNLWGIPPRVTPGVYWTREQCGRALDNDLRVVEKRVNKLLAGAILTQSQFDGLVSFDFEDENLVSSTIPAKMLSGDVAGAIAILLQYDALDGEKLARLSWRRKCEAELLRGNIDMSLSLNQIKGP